MKCTREALIESIYTILPEMEKVNSDLPREVIIPDMLRMVAEKEFIRDELQPLKGFEDSDTYRIARMYCAEAVLDCGVCMCINCKRSRDPSWGYAPCKGGTPSKCDPPSDD